MGPGYQHIGGLLLYQGGEGGGFVLHEGRGGPLNRKVVLPHWFWAILMSTQGAT